MGYKIKYYKEGLGVEKKGKFDSFPNHLIRFKDQDKKIFLKIDIDGGEYEVFKNEDFLVSLKNVVQLAIEFHNVKDRLVELKNIMESVNHNLTLVHIHANNWGGTFEHAGKQVPNVLELTFIANTFIEEKEFDKVDYPVKDLDFPNNPTLPEIDLSHFTANF